MGDFAFSALSVLVLGGHSFLSQELELFPGQFSSALQFNLAVSVKTQSSLNRGHNFGFLKCIRAVSGLMHMNCQSVSANHVYGLEPSVNATLGRR